MSEWEKADKIVGSVSQEKLANWLASLKISIDGHFAGLESLASAGALINCCPECEAYINLVRGTLYRYDKSYAIHGMCSKCDAPIIVKVHISEVSKAPF